MLLVFDERRKTEPKSIFKCRTFSMIVILIILGSYTTRLTYDIVKDTPVVTTKLKTTTDMKLPSVAIAFQYKYTISCVLQYRTTASTIDECSKYITQPTPADYGVYVGLFTPPLSLKVIPSESQQEGVRGVLLKMTVNDANFSLADINIYRILLRLIDTETYVNTNNETINEVRNIDSTFVDSILKQTQYIIFYHQANYLTYSENERIIIKPNILAAIGFSQTIRIPYLTTALTSGPLAEDYSTIKPNVYGTVNISPNSFLNKHVLGSLGLLGGAWSLAITAYTSLFGSKLLTPWGIIHSYCCCFVRSTRPRLGELFPVLPLQSSRLLDNSSTLDVLTSSSNLSFQDNRTLQQRLDALELFLKDYVVDQKYLEHLNAKKHSNKISEFLGTWTWKGRKKNNSITNNTTSTPLVSSTESDSNTIDTSTVDITQLQ
ncbi:189_t:CDS:2 [Paraglomus occultum]|uniref:189_t:CDS:1 n=1 Tax=Paraglomus occultum TaxID=144539 RepID=A0A9N9C296_9GLOM|nr:189_t:CDS:2 [Paraglomus occultum]